MVLRHDQSELRTENWEVGSLDIDVDLVCRLVAAQFPEWSHLTIAPVTAGGWDHRTFRLGHHMTVRLPSAEAYAAQVEKEQQWLPRLAPLLPLAIPTPLARGRPSNEFPWHWSIYRWIAGETASIANISNMTDFAVQLGRFLNRLQQVDTWGGPRPGPHNFYRGGWLGVYDQETRQAISDLDGQIDRVWATRVWEAALAAPSNDPAVWIHGDVEPTNLLVNEGQLSAVIDFGLCGVGDPACDLVMAWTFFSGKGRDTFRANLLADDGTWLRARGWALWKGLIQLAETSPVNSAKRQAARQVVETIRDEDDQFRC
jgi:aminoglycoside phosphotransferase (APT) family kinase protein